MHYTCVIVCPSVLCSPRQTQTINNEPPVAEAPGNALRTAAVRLIFSSWGKQTIQVLVGTRSEI